MSNEKDNSMRNVLIAAGIGLVALGAAYLAYNSMSSKPEEKPASSPEVKEAAPKAPVPKEGEGEEGLVEEKKAEQPGAPVKEAAKEGEGEEEEEKKPTIETLPEPAAPAAAISSTSGECSRDTLVAFFRDMLRGMESTIYSLGEYQQQLMTRTMTPDEEAESHQFISRMYGEKMAQVQQAAFRLHNTNERALEEASKKYKNDPEFCLIVSKMEDLNKALIDQQAPPDPALLAKLPASLTVQRLIEVFKEISAAMSQAMIKVNGEFMKTFKEKGASNAQGAAFESALEKEVSKARDVVLKKYEITGEIMEIAMSKYMKDQDLANAVIQVHKEQKEMFERLRKQRADAGMSLLV